MGQSVGHRLQVFAVRQEVPEGAPRWHVRGARVLGEVGHQDDARSRHRRHCGHDVHQGGCVSYCVVTSTCESKPTWAISVVISSFSLKSSIRFHFESSVEKILLTFRHKKLPCATSTTASTICKTAANGTIPLVVAHHLAFFKLIGTSFLDISAYQRLETQPSSFAQILVY